MTYSGVTNLVPETVNLTFLQKVKNALLVTYPQTALRGDGQVVVTPFNQTP
ncbi:hypothetical protein [Bradyrhizobium valentinum]|uniref:hypothetical protein n=1 Tax=Bradyrhizobium valentinum TaxID=1518501 RepID=UPI000A7EE03D|nr:hypothetical protein [Bradyrhizobium valentinum]